MRPQTHEARQWVASPTGLRWLQTETGAKCSVEISIRRLINMVDMGELEYNMKDKLCVWKDSYLKGGTTFYGCEEWDETHPLYKCLSCDGYGGNGCKHYITLKILKERE